MLASHEGGYSMKSLQLSLPDPVMTEVNGLVHEGWFRNNNELIRAAVLDFVRRHRFTLTEQFQREDIAWALKQKRER